MRKRSQESKPQLLTNYSEIMHHLPQHTPDERDELEREKIAHAQLIEWRREKQRQALLQELAERQQERLRNILK